MTDVAVDTLRLRGPHARRLAAVAARTLPAALERALADVGEVRADEIVVRLHPDVTAHDDDTLAVLWADAIRAQVLALRHGLPPDTAARPPAAVPVGGPEPAPPDVLTAIRAYAATGPAAGTPLPRAVLALADPATAQAVAGAAGPHEWAALLRTLSRALRLPAPGRRAGARPAAEGDRTESPHPNLPPAPAATATDAQQRATEKTDTSRERMRPAGLPSGVLDVVAALARLVDGQATHVEPAALTRAAGLVLLYPWLAEHCRLAEDLHPGPDGLDVREAALAAIVDPGDPALVDDPLVGTLAGRTSPRRGRTRRPLPRAEEVAESAVRVLTSFTALLPGFERSSPAYVRDSWIARLGVVDTDRSPVLLTAACRPLDPLLARLPYPVGLIKLPWSPPLTVRFRP
ncbi:contractile injection system tape measure protein [Kitasatospora sp. NPDC048365]|uniref:contractile injection system tape measure protein n=1 Tax=Kitasatospora sp. NPDC048365 TaxID=3364050 RepID=UPI0037202D21